MTPDLTPCAYAVFSDNGYAKMLENELRLRGFAVVHNKEKADLVLLENSSAASYEIADDRYFKLIFLDDISDKTGRSSKKKLFVTKLFFIDDMEVILKRLYDTIYSQKIIEYDERIKKEQRAAVKPTKFERPEIRVLSTEGKRSIWVGEKRIKLSAHEWVILDMLSKAAEKEEFVPREILSRAIGHEDSNGNIVDVYIFRLRKKLEIPYGHKLIFSVRGKGYILKN